VEIPSGVVVVGTAMLGQDDDYDAYKIKRLPMAHNFINTSIYIYNITRRRALQ
jgi:hypothetical protein